MNKLKHLFPFPKKFRRHSIFLMTFLILALSQTAHAVTISYNFTGHLSGVQNFLGIQYVTPITGSFSVDVDTAENADTTSYSILSSYMAMTQFSLSVDGTPAATVYENATGQVDVWNTGALMGDRVDLETSIDGGNISAGGTTYAPDTAALLFRFKRSLNVLSSTDLAPAIQQLDYLSLLVNSESHGHLTYRNVMDNSDTKVQYFHFDYIGDNDQFAALTAAPAPVPEPGTLVLLGSGLAGMFFFRKKKT